MLLLPLNVLTVRQAVSEKRKCFILAHFETTVFTDRIAGAYPKPDELNQLKKTIVELPT